MAPVKLNFSIHYTILLLFIVAVVVFFFGGGALKIMQRFKQNEQTISTHSRRDCTLPFWQTVEKISFIVRQIFSLIFIKNIVLGKVQ